MRTTTRNWLAFLLMACSLLFGGGLSARDANSDTPGVALGAADSTSTPQLEETEAGGTNDDIGATTTRKGKHGRSGGSHVRNVRHGDQAVIGHDVEVKAGETVDEIVVIRGSATVRGKVLGDVTVVFGNLDVQGEVDGDAVAVLGSIRVGTNATVKGDAVAVLGGVDVQPNASMGGDVVGIGGRTQVADGASVRGDIIPIGLGLGSKGLPRWLNLWLGQCFLKLRPLAPQVGWVWAVAGVFFLVYLFVAAVFPRPVRACVDELTRRPATTFLFGLLTKMLAPFVALVLVITILGIIVVPFFGLALLVAAIVGKVALLQWIGLSLGRSFGAEPLKKPLIAFLAGSIVITLLYLVPVLGLITSLLAGVWGLGIAVTTLFGSFRRELPPQPVVLQPAAGMASTGAAGLAGAGQGGSAGVAGQGAGDQGGTTAFAAAPVSGPQLSAQPGATTSAGPGTSGPLGGAGLPNVPEVLAYRKAGFWERAAAAFLDFVLIVILAGMADKTVLPLGGALFPLVTLAYFTGMWAWKGTSVGSIVLGLKVAREDGKPVTFAVALVRALAAAFSVIMCFLGFLWIAWDPYKQGWHDKIAGTVVLKLPRGTPLV
jgi:uncharacterized RDD family membrane protein YckC